MNFVVVAQDGTDKDAPNRRQAVRKAHLEGIEKRRKAGQILMACAHLNENGTMIGSTVVCNFSSRKDLDNWLMEEPYITGNVWQKVDVYPCKIPPAFL